MGSSTKQSDTSFNQDTTKNPYAPTIPGGNYLAGQIGDQIQNAAPESLNPVENQAYNNLLHNAYQGNPYASGINSLASNLLAGGGPDRSGYTTQGLQQLQSSLSPIANQSTNPYDNQAFQQLQSTLSGDITNQIKSQYAGAGYSPTSSGDFAQQLGRGISQGVAPAFVDAQNNLTSQRMAAANPLYQAGANTTGILSGLDQTRLGNQLQGVQTSTDALNANDSPYTRMLQLSQQWQQAPVQKLGNLESLLVPMAGLGGTQNTNGTQNTTQTSNPGLLGTIGQGIGVLNGGLGLLGW